MHDRERGARERKVRVKKYRKGGERREEVYVYEEG